MHCEDTSKTMLQGSAAEGPRNDWRNARHSTFRAHLGAVLFLTAIFFVNFVSRIILSPFLPTIEKELAINHSQAGFLFFLSSTGYLVGLLSSGLIAARTTHRWMIAASAAGVGAAMLFIAAAQNLWMIRSGLFWVGFSAGLYMPSAIATITALVNKNHWGKAIAVHELAPNMAFFVSPFIAEFFLGWSSWRSALGVIGALSLVASVIFLRFGKGGVFAGESPISSAFGELIRMPALWLMVLLFSLGVSATVGVYAMLPLYLITERGLTPSWANTVVAFSRVHGPLLGLLGGWASDKLGTRQTIIISMGFTGVATMLLGWVSNFWLGLFVLLQPLVAVWFFPAAFAAIAAITPAHGRNLAVALSVPFGFVIGGGAIPTFIGVMGDAGSFATGLIVTGALITFGGVLALRLKLPDAQAAR
jgi:NNP family nitrate/nitrite transporter-like MFS transporter